MFSPIFICCRLVQAMNVLKFYWVCIQKLTVDADNFNHRDGEEGHWGQVHLDKHSCQEKNDEDDRQAARDPQLLRNPATNTGDKSNLQLSNKKSVWNRKLSFRYNWVMIHCWTDVRGLETGFLRSSSHSGKKCKKIKNRSCASSRGQVFCSWQKKGQQRGTVSIWRKGRKGSRGREGYSRSWGVIET